MDVLTEAAIRAEARASDKEDAIRQSGELLVKAGYVSQAYIMGMLAREQVMPTYLGNGVAIPHGQYESRQYIHETGISVLQLPEGVEWTPGETVYLVIGIAAANNEHTDILANIAEVIEEQDAVMALVHCKDAKKIIEMMTAPKDLSKSEA